MSCSGGEISSWTSIVNRRLVNWDGNKETLQYHAKIPRCRNRVCCWASMREASENEMATSRSTYWFDERMSERRWSVDEGPWRLYRGRIDRWSSSSRVGSESCSVVWWRKWIVNSRSESPVLSRMICNPTSLILGSMVDLSPISSVSIVGGRSESHSFRILLISKWSFLMEEGRSREIRLSGNEEGIVREETTVEAWMKDWRRDLSRTSQSPAWMTKRKRSSKDLLRILQHDRSTNLSSKRMNESA